MTHLRVDPVLRFVLYRNYITRSFAFAGARRKATNSVEAIDLFDCASRSVCFGFQSQPFDVRRGLRGKTFLNLLGLCVAEANDIEVWCRIIDEEMRSNRLGRFLDGPKSRSPSRGIIDHSTRSVEELSDSTDGAWWSSEVRATSVVLCSFT